MDPESLAYFQIHTLQYLYNLYDKVFYLPSSETAQKVKEVGLEDHLPPWWDFEQQKIDFPELLDSVFFSAGTNHVHPYTAQQLLDDPSVWSLAQVEERLTGIYPAAKDVDIFAMALNYVSLRELPSITEAVYFGPSAYLIAAARTLTNVGVNIYTQRRSEVQQKLLIYEAEPDQRGAGARYLLLREEIDNREIRLAEKLPRWEEELRAYQPQIQEDLGLHKLTLSDQDAFLQPIPLQKIREVYTISK